MRHKDGIEVYLRPTNSRREIAQFAETVLPLTNDYLGHRKRCVVDHDKAPVNLMIELHPTFKTNGASALRIGVHPNPKAKTKRKKIFAKHMSYVFMHAGKISKGPCAILVDDNSAFRMPPIKTPPEDDPNPVVWVGNEAHFLREQHFDLQSIVVTVERGDVTWLDENDAVKTRPKEGLNFVKGSFKGDYQRYVFEFFSRERDLSAVAPIEATSPKIKEKKKSPKICNCPHPATCSTGRSGKFVADRKKPRHKKASGLSSSTQEKCTNQENDLSEPTLAHSSVPKETPVAAEMRATTCGRCKNLQKPGQGKKIAWRKRTNAWMVVDARAHDEEPPDEEVDERASLAGEEAETQFPESPEIIEDGHEPGADDIPQQDDQVSDGSGSRYIEKTTEQPMEPSIGREASGQRASNSTAPFIVADSASAQAHVESSTLKAQAPSAGSQLPTLVAGALEDTPAQPRLDDTPAYTTPQALQHHQAADDQGLYASRSIDGLQVPEPCTSNLQRSVSRPTKNSQGKRPMAEIDLTGDSDDDTPTKKEVKLEDGTDDDRKSLLGGNMQTRDEAVLREELQDIKMARKELQLEKRQMFVERQLKKKLHEKGSVSTPIKIEEDE